MSVTVQCPNSQCRQLLQATDELRGRPGRCPSCGEEFRVPGVIQAGQTVDAQHLHRLQVQAGPDLVGQFIELRPQKLYEFGKSDECTVQLPGTSVSRHHCLIQWVNDQWIISDLNSTNGTFVNGVRTGRSVLRDNDEIAVGKYRLRFLAPRPTATAPTAGPDEAAHLPLVEPTGSEKEPDLSVAQDESGSASAEPLDALLREARSAQISTRIRLPGIDDSGERIKSQEAEVAGHYRRWILSRLAIVVVMLLAAGGISKVVWRALIWKPEAPGPTVAPVQHTGDRAPEKGTLPDETRARISDLIARDQLDEAQRQIEGARASGATDEVVRALRDQLRNATQQRELNRLRLQVEETIAQRDWARANELLNRATTMPSVPGSGQQWGALREQIRRGPMVELLRSSQAKVEKQDFEGAVADAENAFALDPTDPEARAWLGSVRQRAGGTLSIETGAGTRGGREVVTDLASGSPSPRYHDALLAPRLAETQSSALPALGEKPPIAVVPFEVYGDIRVKDAGVILAEALLPSFGERYTLIDQMQLRRFLAQDDMTLGALAEVAHNPSGKTFSKAARLRAVRYLVVGSVSGLPNGRVSVTARLTDWQTGEVGPGGAAQVNADNWAQLLERLPLLAAELTGHTEKCRLCRGTGEVPCRTCAGTGTGKALCPKCDGRRKILCPQCKGKWEETCNACNGSGKVKVTRSLGSVSITGAENCPICGGKGHHVTCQQCDRGYVICPLCNGTGRHGPCPACNGTGRIECPRCSGVGKVPTTQQAE